MLFIPINFPFVCYIQFTKGRIYYLCGDLIIKKSSPPPPLPGGAFLGYRRLDISAGNAADTVAGPCFSEKGRVKSATTVADTMADPCFSEK